VSSDFRAFGIDHAGEIVLSVIFVIRLIFSRSRLVYKFATFFVLLGAMYVADREHVNPFGPDYFHSNILPGALLLVYVVYTFALDRD
jgi:hypothetical protein